jgi:hypothetical protein
MKEKAMLVNQYGIVEEVEEPGFPLNNPGLAHIRALEGRHVHLALADGSRIDDCQLVSAGRDFQDTVWVFTKGIDTFIPLTDVIEAWEATSSRSEAASFGFGT